MSIGSRHRCRSWPFTAPGYDGLPLVMCRLPEVDVTRLAELIGDAHRMRLDD